MWCSVPFCLCHALSQVHRQGDLGDEVDGMKDDTVELLDDDDGWPERGALWNSRKTHVTAQREGDAEVAQTIPHERVSEPMVEHIVVDVPVPQVVEEVEEVLMGSERIMEHIVFEVPVPQISEDITEVFQVAPQKHIQARIAEQREPPVKEESWKL